MPRLFSLAILSCMLLFPASPLSAAGSPAIQPETLKGYVIAWKGSGWPDGGIVAFTLSQKGQTVGVELTVTKTGGFLVGVKRLQACFGAVYQARDLDGDSAGIVADPFGCPKGAEPTRPKLKVLRGRRVQATATHVRKLPHPAVTIRQGDALTLWESAKASPRWMPNPPTQYFDLLKQLQTAAGRCGKPRCGPGFFWKWIGMKAGTTNIALVPWCNGHPCPNDVVLALRVTITPR
ncbi:MAG TPA: hypothetical protein VFB34_01065 [Chloroflexota bacterium]|nr:hypothetical protein [Chloroflexota bacterium]